MSKRGLTLVVLACGLGGLAAAGEAVARPLGAFGSNCSGCHGDGGIVGPFPQQLEDETIAVVGEFAAEIPDGAFGDPDRGEGPLQAYEAAPGSTFTLVIDITEPSSITPDRFSVALKGIEHTDPDYQLGNPDPGTWENDALTLVGARLDGNGLNDIPFDETGWTLHTDTSGGVNQGLEYYTSSDTFGHVWSGPLQLMLSVSVPGGVLPGWYDIEVAVAGRDTPLGSGFYEDEHFYLHVIPEPATLLLLGAVALTRRRRNRSSERLRGRAKAAPAPQADRVLAPADTRR